MDTLNKQAYQGIGKFVIAMMLLTFLPAWTFNYWQAWVMIVLVSGLSLLVTLYLMKYDRHLLEKRMSAGPGAEKGMTQKIIMSIASLAFIAEILIPALDHRFMWSQVPTNIVILGDALIMLGFLIIFFVFKENTFTAGTVEIHENQKVVSTGLYGWVRHPMYSGGLIFLFGVPLALGSYWGLLAFIPITLAIIWRLLDEEALLAKDLAGYTEYQQKVRSRLIPYIW